MVEPVGQYEPRRLVGDEALPRGATVLDFWRWMGSDLVLNTTRGALAEYLVALAVDAVDGLQEGWASYDIGMRDGTAIEVKTSAYIQSWPQKKKTTPKFDVDRKAGWDAETGEYVDEKRRWSDVYVFCLHHHDDRATLDPLVLSQWTFFVLSRTVLDARLGEQKSIGLRGLWDLGAKEVPFGGIAGAVRKAAPPPEDQRVS